MSVAVIKGDDQTLVSQALSATVAELLNGGDRTLMTEEITDAELAVSGAEPDVTPLVNALSTPPFLTERRIVIGRNLAMFSKAAQVAPLVEAISNLMEEIDVVLVWEKGGTATRLSPIPKSLNECLKSVGARIVQAAPSGRGRKMLLEERLDMAPVRLDRAARATVVDRVGDDVGRLDAIFSTLVSTYGVDSEVSSADVEPFLGAESDVPPWDLTDAIDSANIALALKNLGRMVAGGNRHSLVVLATLNNHYQRALALDGSGVTDEKSAAALLGIKGSTFPAKKAMQLSRKLGPEKLQRIVGLLADADLDVRGRSAVPPEMVIEVLVARLARMSR